MRAITWVQSLGVSVPIVLTTSPLFIAGSRSRLASMSGRICGDVGEVVVTPLVADVDSSVGRGQIVQNESRQLQHQNGDLVDMNGKPV